MTIEEADPAAGPADQALASFVLLAQFLGVPAEPSQIHHDRGQGDRPYNFDDLVRIAKKLGLIARWQAASTGLGASGLHRGDRQVQIREVR